MAQLHPKTESKLLKVPPALDVDAGDYDLFSRTWKTMHGPFYERLDVPPGAVVDVACGSGRSWR